MIDEKEQKRLLTKAGAYCAKAERSAKEVTDKLYKWSLEPISAEEVEQILEWLRSQHFIDEERYVRHFVADKTELLGKGPFMLRRELRGKGVSDEAIERELAAIPDAKWIELLECYLAPKLERYRKKAKSAYDLRRRLMTAAYGRGYPSEITEEVLREMDLTVEGDDEERWYE